MLGAGHLRPEMLLVRFPRDHHHHHYFYYCYYYYYLLCCQLRLTDNDSGVSSSILPEVSEHGPPLQSAPLPG